MSGLSVDILEYLDRHPGAKDTLEGIVEWWILEMQIQHAISHVKASLNVLVEMHWVQETTARDGRVFYKLNRKKQKSIQQFLAKLRAGQKENVAGQEVAG